MWSTDANLNKYFSNEDLHVVNPAVSEVTSITPYPETRPEYQSQNGNRIQNVTSFSRLYLDKIESRLALRLHQDNVVPGGTGWVSKIVNMFEKQNLDSLDEKERLMSWNRNNHIQSPSRFHPVVNDCKPDATFPKNIFSPTCFKGQNSNEFAGESQPNPVSSPLLVNLLESKRRLKPTQKLCKLTTTREDCVQPKLFSLDGGKGNKVEMGDKPNDVLASTSMQPQSANRGSLTVPEVASPAKPPSTKKMTSPSKFFPAILSKTKSLLDVRRTFSKKSNHDKSFKNTCCWTEREDSQKESTTSKPRKSWSAMDVKFKRLDDPFEDDFSSWVPGSNSSKESQTKTEDTSSNFVTIDLGSNYGASGSLWSEMLDNSVETSEERTNLKATGFEKVDPWLENKKPNLTSDEPTNSLENKKITGKVTKSWLTRWSEHRRAKAKETDNSKPKTRKENIKTGSDMQGTATVTSHPTANTKNEVFCEEKRRNVGKNFLSRTYSKLSFN